MSSYTAICERVGDWWEITVPELDSVTQAKTRNDVHNTVLDLVALMTGAEPWTIDLHFHWPEDARTGVSAEGDGQ